MITLMENGEELVSTGLIILTKAGEELNFIKTKYDEA